MIVYRSTKWMNVLTALAICALLVLGTSEANAATCPPSSEYATSLPGTQAFPDRQAAYEYCIANIPKKYLTSGGYYTDSIGCKANEQSRWYNMEFQAHQRSVSGSCSPNTTILLGNPGFTWPAMACPAGTTWNDAIKRCFNPEECLQRNAGLGANPARPSLTTTRCVAGCEFKMQANPEVTVNVSTSGGTAATVYRGVMEYSGNTCATPSIGEEGKGENGPEPPPTCTPVAGQTICIKPNGEHCTQVSGTRQLCWGPGETGPKTDGPKLAERQAGETPPVAPTIPPPPGETFQQEASPVKSSTSNVGGPASGGGGNRTTNITVYGTTQGTNAGGAGGKDQGEPAGNGKPGGSTGGKEGGEGTASGGTDCKTPPITTGDAVLGMVATQAWATKCAVEAGNAAKVTGDVGDCASPYTVEGENANAEQLRALRAQICPNEGEGDGNGTEGGTLDGDAEEMGFTTEGTPIGGDFDTGGFGYSRSCPAMPSISVLGQSIQLDNSVMCDWLGLGGALVLVLAALASIRIMAMGG